MIDLKKIYIEVFNAIKNDTTLLDLLEINHTGIDTNTLVGNIRKQVLDTSTPDDLLTNNATRICIYEEQSSSGFLEETGYIRLDIHITQDKNKIDRRMLQIASRISKVLDTDERKKNGKNKLNIGLYGLNKKRRVPNQNSYITGWDKYSLVFEYKYIV